MSYTPEDQIEIKMSLLYAAPYDRKGNGLKPGDCVRIKTYPQGTAEGTVVISRTAREVLPDGSAPALAVDCEGTIYRMPPSKAILKIG